MYHKRRRKEGGDQTVDGWMDGEKKSLSVQGLNMQEGERHIWHRVNWSDVLSID